MEDLARAYLWGVGGLFLLVYVLPFLFAPLGWARWFRWRIPAETELTVYFARCLGAVGLGLIVACWRAAGAPREHLALFELLAIAGGGLLLVHVWGALRRQQPWTETVEIGLYAAATAGAIALRAGL